MTSKVYCKTCLIVDLEQLTLEDMNAMEQGRLTAVRTECEIRTYRASANCFHLRDWPRASLP